MNSIIQVGLLCCLLCLQNLGISAEGFSAFSLREAQNCVKLGMNTGELRTLGGITRFAAMVYDRQGKDIVLVGRAAPVLPECRLDDLVVAFRSRLVLGEWPTVSIDPTDKTQITGHQAVTFHGGLAETGFGKDFLDCDIILKKYSLGLLRTVPGVQTFKDLEEQHLRQLVEGLGNKLGPFKWLSSKDSDKVCSGLRGRPVNGETAYQIQFWFYGREPFHVKYMDDVFCIEDLQLLVKVKVMKNNNEGEGGGVQSSDEAAVGIEFAEQFTGNFSQVAAIYPVLNRLKGLFDMVAIAEGIRTTGNCEILDYFLRQYHIPLVATLSEQEQVDLFGIAESQNGTHHLLYISGGIRFQTQLQWMNDGDVGPLKEIVLDSRPGPNALSWSVPLEEWQMPNSAGLTQQDSPFSAPAKPDDYGKTTGEGCTFNLQALSLGPESPVIESDLRKRFVGVPPPPPPTPILLEGVSMQMQIDDRSYKKDESGQLDNRRDKILRGRGDKDALSWP